MADAMTPFQESVRAPIDLPLSVAPMMDWTDRHDRYLLRCLSRRTKLYTEMVTTGAVLHGNRDRLLAIDPAEHPVALQLGGSDPPDLAECARIGAGYGYDEINLNVGCPSDRVQSGRFGACLMAEPALVAECVAAMQAATDVPVTVKHRLGIDDQDEEASLNRFVDTVADAGCRHFIVHARKAWLSGLSPKQNRDVPPLRYELVAALKRRRPDLFVVLNGGVTSLEAAKAHLAEVDGVMIGRAAYQEPYILAAADREIFGDHAPAPSRHEVLARMADYAERQVPLGVPLKSIARHMTGLFNGLPGARAYRRRLNDLMQSRDADSRALLAAAAHIDENAHAAAA